MKTLVYFSCFLILLSCKKAPPEFDLETVFPEAIGSWQWEETIYPYGGNYGIEPLVLDYKMNVSKFGEIEILRDNLTIDKLFIEGYVERIQINHNGWISRRYEFIGSPSLRSVDQSNLSSFYFYHLETENKLCSEIYPFNAEWPDNYGSSVSPFNIYYKLD